MTHEDICNCQPAKTSSPLRCLPVSRTRRHDQLFFTRIGQALRWVCFGGLPRNICSSSGDMLHIYHTANDAVNLIENSLVLMYLQSRWYINKKTSISNGSVLDIHESRRRSVSTEEKSDESEFFSEKIKRNHCHVLLPHFTQQRNSWNCDDIR
jgi:hypothetical protein